MSEEGRKILRAAREIIETELLMGGDLMPAVRNPLPPTLKEALAPSIPPGPAMPPLGLTPAPGPKALGTPVEILNEAQALSARTPDEKAAALASLATQAGPCAACPLGGARLNLVFGEGNPAAELVFVGEAPGADEDATGRPFVGRAGELLTKMIVAMGITRQDVYICNVLKCRPPDNRPPTPEEVVSCWPLLVRQLQIIRPKVIVTLGNPATQSLLATREGITRIRGQWQKLPNIGQGLEGIDVMPTFHPSFVLRNYNAETRGKVWDDLQKVMEKLGIRK